ncbi:hypothetical protein [Rufibacter sp. LB8]|uniref:hypothetical protein n=1 Tax=Rufibacter sp. LB8 TaxID=2777781 RepID=UPI00178C1DCA|nr:hypothetical protein [Rufibacter sp. LB8]
MGLTDIIAKLKKEWAALKGEETKDKLFQNENTFPDEAAAQQAFEQAKAKLFDVNKWSNLEGINSTFQLFGAAGEPSDKTKPQVGDFMQIILPATNIENWVAVTEVTEEETAAQFVVKPSPPPAPKTDQPEVVKHFFTHEASSTFLVYLDGLTLHGLEIGKDEAINNQGQEAGDRAVLNTMISEGGWAGFQSLQWNKITRYFVHLEEVKK